MFLRLYTTLKKGETIENPRGWVFRVAHNYGLKVRARQASEEPFDPALESPPRGARREPRAKLLEARAHDPLSPRGGRPLRTTKALSFLAVWKACGIPKSGPRWESARPPWASSCGARPWSG